MTVDVRLIMIPPEKDAEIKPNTFWYIPKVLGKGIDFGYARSVNMSSLYREERRDLD
jgi:hypothetical protein